MSENLDFSKALETVQQMLTDDDGQAQIQNILSMFTSGSEENAKTDKIASLPALQNSNDPFNVSDLDMLLKIKNIMTAMSNQNNSAQTEFLYKLKPLLKNNRREKLEQAIKFMNAAKVLKAFKDINEGGG